MNKGILLLTIFISIGYTCLIAQKIDNQDRMISIFFDGGSYYIDDNQFNRLEDFINEIEDIREFEIELHGHTDNIGSIEYNQYLSTMRSQATYNLLIMFHIDPKIITRHDFGELSPVYSNDTWRGKLHNRRVDIIFKKIVI